MRAVTPGEYRRRIPLDALGQGERQDVVRALLYGVPNAARAYATIYERPADAVGLEAEIIGTSSPLAIGVRTLDPADIQLPPQEHARGAPVVVRAGAGWRALTGHIPAAGVVKALDVTELAAMDWESYFAGVDVVDGAPWEQPPQPQPDPFATEIQFSLSPASARARRHKLRRQRTKPPKESFGAYLVEDDRAGQSPRHGPLSLHRSLRGAYRHALGRGEHGIQITPVSIFPSRALDLRDPRVCGQWGIRRGERPAAEDLTRFLDAGHDVVYLPAEGGEQAGELPDVLLLDPRHASLAGPAKPVEPPSEASHLYQDRAAIERAGELAEWLGSGAILDENGAPAVLYHGTKAGFQDFRLDVAGTSQPGFMGAAIYLTPDPEEASRYAMDAGFGDGDAPNVRPVVVALNAPCEINDDRLPDGRNLRRLFERGVSLADGQGLLDSVRAQGYDGVIRYSKGRIVEVVAFSPEQVRPSFAFREAGRSLNALLQPPARRLNAPPPKLEHELRYSILKNKQQVRGRPLGLPPTIAQWLERSRVVDDGGMPIVRYLVSSGSNAEPSDDDWRSLRVHLTSTSRARTALSARPCYVRVSLPIQITEPDDWRAGSVLKRLQEEHPGLIDAANAQYIEQSNTPMWALRSVLLDMGFDGLMYRQAECGEMAYVAFRSDQVHYLNAPAADAADLADILLSEDILDDYLVRDSDGAPLLVYRGEHGNPGSAPFQTRRGSLSFGDREAANLYSMEPNERGDNPVAPRVLPAYITMRRAAVNDPSDPFIDLGKIASCIGKDKARSIAVDLADRIEELNLWHERAERMGDVAGTCKTVRELLDKRPDLLDQLYIDAYHVFDSPSYVRWFREAGYDGAIHAGNGATANSIEYKVFDGEQVISPWSALSPSATPAQRRLTEAEQRMASRGPPTRIIPVAESRPDLEAVARRFGRRLVYFAQCDKHRSVNGFVMPDEPQTVYINLLSPHPLSAVLGHELTHFLKREDPDAYNALFSVAQAHYKGPGTLSEEVLCDYVGMQFTEPGFLRSLDREQDGLAARVLGFMEKVCARAIETLDKWSKTIRGQDNECGAPLERAALIKDCETIRAATRSALLALRESASSVSHPESDAPAPA